MSDYSQDKQNINQVISSKDKLEQLQSQRDDLLEALEKYGDHLGACFINLTMGKCNCGFDDIIAKAKQS